MRPIRLNLIVAACKSNQGIGVNGTLPWKIPGDLAFFKRITTQTNEINKQNVVIMGRKTWESIPGKFRPLCGRLNVVVSTTLQNLPSGVRLAKSFDDAIQLLNSDDLKDCFESVFIIGGASLYKLALESPFCYRIYLTEVLQDFTCDTFLPKFDVDLFQLIELPQVPTDVRTEGGIPYRFMVYQKTSSVEAENGGNRCLPFIAICAAVELNGGFGKNGQLPWPHIKTDYEHFTSLVTRTDNPGKKTAVIKARKTWESTSEDEDQSLSSTIRIVISTTMENHPETVDYIVKSFDEAIEVGLKLWRNGEVEKIWILGGKQIFQEAIDSPMCRFIYLTRVLAPFDCDLFFPAFDHCFKQTRILKEELDEGSQVKIRCEVYERI